MEARGHNQVFSEIQKLVEEREERIIRLLTTKFDLNFDEACEACSRSNGRKTMIEMKSLPKKSSTPKKRSNSKIPIPFCGIINQDECFGVRLNHGLYTQCLNGKDDGDLCNTCLNQSKKNVNGLPTYGLITNRKEKGGDFRDPKGKQPIRYANLMLKLNISREEAEEAAAKNKIQIPEYEFEVKTTKRGRPKKDTSAKDTSDEESVISTSPISTPRQRGRPKKEKKQVCQRSSENVKSEHGIRDVSYENSSTENEEEKNNESSDEETAVVVIVYNEKKYLKAADNTIYDIQSHDEIGNWNEDTESIQFT
jgi:hypothetical protein